MECLSIKDVLERLEAMEIMDDHLIASNAKKAARERCAFARRLKAACVSGFTPSEFVRVRSYLQRRIRRSESDPTRMPRLQEFLEQVEAAPLLKATVQGEQEQLLEKRQPVVGEGVTVTTDAHVFLAAMRESGFNIDLERLGKSGKVTKVDLSDGSVLIDGSWWIASAALQGYEAAHLQSLTPTIALKETSEVPTIGNDVRIAFLGGDEFVVPIIPGMLIADIKAKLAAEHPVPSYHALHVLHQGRLLPNSEDASEFVGSQLFAVFTKLRLSHEASCRLRESTEVDPEETDIGLFEVNSELKLVDMSVLAEVLQSVQPERFIMKYALTDGCLEALADYISVDLLRLKSLEMMAPLPKSLPHVARLLRRCPALTSCDLKPRPKKGSQFYELAREDVEDLRSEFHAQIRI